MPRFFARLTVDQLSDKVVEAVEACSVSGHHCWKELTPQIKKDLSKCNFDMENVGELQSDFGPRGLMGYHTLDNGLTFKGLCAGGDWEIPVFFLIYWDGSKLRGYIPKDGNPWNTATKYPYGNDDDADAKNVKKRYPHLFEGLGVDEIYYDHPGVTWNAEEIRQDILKRFQEK